MRERKKSIIHSLPGGFSERLNKLKQSFLDGLPERLSCNDAALKVIGLESSSPVELQQALNTVRVKTHDLAGAAGTFGFMKLSEFACKAEIACGDLLASDRMPSFAERQMIGELLVAIRESAVCCLMRDPLANERRGTATALDRAAKIKTI